MGAHRCAIDCRHFRTMGVGYALPSAASIALFPSPSAASRGLPGTASCINLSKQTDISDLFGRTCPCGGFAWRRRHSRCHQVKIMGARQANSPRVTGGLGGPKRVPRPPRRLTSAGLAHAPPPPPPLFARRKRFFRSRRCVVAAESAGARSCTFLRPVSRQSRNDILPFHIIMCLPYASSLAELASKPKPYCIILLPSPRA